VLFSGHDVDWDRHRVNSRHEFVITHKDVFLDISSLPVLALVVADNHLQVVGLQM